MKRGRSKSPRSWSRDRQERSRLASDDSRSRPRDRSVSPFDRQSYTRRQLPPTTDDILNFLSVGAIVRGTVKKVESFGAFIEMEGRRRLQGLVHVSQMARDRVENPDDIVSTGDSVFVKVLSIENGTGERARPRVSLSMKYCDQSDGADRDPNGVLAEQDQRKKRVRREDAGPLELGAVYNTSCTKCGGQGHIASECFNTSGNAYALIAEDDDDYLKGTRPTTTAAAVRGASAAAGRGSKGTNTVGGIANGIRSTTSAPVGRGRGAVMPAWMTSKDPEFGGGGIKSSSIPDEGEEGRGDSKHDKKSKSKREKDEKKKRKREGKKEKKEKKEKKKKEKHKHSKKEHKKKEGDSDKDDEKEHKNKKSKKHHDHSDDEDDLSDSYQHHRRDRDDEATRKRRNRREDEEVKHAGAGEAADSGSGSRRRGLEVSDGRFDDADEHKSRKYAGSSNDNERKTLPSSPIRGDRDRRSSSYDGSHSRSRRSRSHSSSKSRSSSSSNSSSSSDSSRSRSR